MKKFKTDNIDVKIFLRRYDDTNEQAIHVQYCQKGELLEAHNIILPAKICKQQFNDANLTQHIINFFIKE